MRFGVAISWLVAAGFVTMVAVDAATHDAREPARSNAKLEIVAFSHTGHVSRFWDLNSEQPRDCRGCHDFAHPDEPPSSKCERCHTSNSATIDAAKALIKPDFEKGRGFQHAQHLVDANQKPLACATCHFGGTGKPAITVPTKSSLAQCVDCHDKTSKNAIAANRDKFNEGMTIGAEQREKTRGNVDRVFRHATHLKAGELASASADVCERCHSGMAHAGTNLSENQFEVKACSTCHAGMEFSTEPVKKPSLTRATFVHSAHLSRNGAVADADLAKDARTKLETNGCLACHTWNAGAGSFALQDSWNSKSGPYQRCAECHSAWSVADHGKVDACKNCHTIQDKGMTEFAAMEQNRPRTDVQRVTPTNFKIERQEHKFVHGDGAPSEDCKGCHVATSANAPSKIGTQPFRHEAHLPANLADATTKPSATLCTGCHTTIQESVHPSNVQGTRWPNDNSPTSFNFDRASCDRCHGTAAWNPTVEASPATKSVLVFDHRAHLNRKRIDGSGNIGCVDCHAISKGEHDFTITMDDKVRGCTLCHGHDDRRGPATLKKDKHYVDSCVHCHPVGIPDAKAEVPVERLAISKQVKGFHRHETADACSTCHVQASAEKAASEPVPATLSVTMSKLAPNPHQQSDFPFFQKQAACMDCHWGNIDKPQEKKSQWENQSNGKLAGVPPRVVEAGRIDKELVMRPKYGSELDGFPGVTSK